MQKDAFDLVIIGGGINGAAIARDGAGRGLHVLLVEQNDLASGTSWTSTKLIHGGLRYLEHGAFRLVQEGLAERARLLRMAPHVIWPARFVLPHHTGLRPAWQLRLGLFVYDLLAGKSLLPGTKRLNLRLAKSGQALQPQYQTAFEYSDACVDDVRLVVLNAMDAASRGAVIETRTRFTHAERHQDKWKITLETKGATRQVTARALVNAAGPWIEPVNALMPPDVARSHVKLVKGSHIVVRKMFDHEDAYIFQNADGRIVFAIPYERDFTLIGTTDEAFAGDPAKVQASANEISYLCAGLNDYFTAQITPADVVWSFAGIRALYDNRSLREKDLSRDYLLQLDAGEGKAPLLSVYGGKLTAARHVAEVVLDKLKAFLPMKHAWTESSTLPGGDFAWDGFDALLAQTKIRWPFLSHVHAARLLRAYGTRIEKILGEATRMEDLGACFGSDFTASELSYLMQQEWAQTVDDVLWRRSKMGLHLSASEQKKIADFMRGA